MSIRILTTDDVPQALALSQAVGWNQTAADWALAIEMNPEGCFAMEEDGQVVATTTTIRYGTELAWVGMVLTHPDYRCRGFARALMERALDHLADVETIKLDATKMGTPLYRKLGFVEECAIERWIGWGIAGKARAKSMNIPETGIGSDWRSGQTGSNC